MYDAADRAKLRIESGGLFEDLPRRADGDAIIADPRNDEHLIIAGLHAAFLRFHNAAVELVRKPGLDVAQVYTEALRLTTWHYQWLVLHEFLPLFVGQALVDEVLSRGRRFYLPAAGAATIPVEFQPGWQPTLPQRGGDFQMTDFLRFAASIPRAGASSPGDLQ